MFLPGTSVLRTFQGKKSQQGLLHKLRCEVGGAGGPVQVWLTDIQLTTSSRSTNVLGAPLFRRQAQHAPLTSLLAASHTSGELGASTRPALMAASVTSTMHASLCAPRWVLLRSQAWDLLDSSPDPTSAGRWAWEDPAQVRLSSVPFLGPAWGSSVSSVRSGSQPVHRGVQSL